MAAKDEEEKTEGAPAEEVKPKSKKKLISIIAVVVLLLGGGAGAFLMMGGEKKDPAHEEEKAREEVLSYATVELDPFIVNLSENSSFLKVKILLEYDPSLVGGASGGGAGGAGGTGGGHGGGGAGGEKGLPGIMGEREPMIRDAIIRVISGKKAAGVLSLEGKEQLKEELIEAINEAIGLDEAPVVNLYFVDFIVQ